MDPSNKRNNLLFKLMGRPYPVALEHVATIIANPDQFFTKLLQPQSPKFKQTFQHKANMFSEVVDISTISTHRRMGILLHCSTTYKWIDNHWVLSIAITSFTLTVIMEVTANVALMASKKTLCMTFPIPQPDPLVQCFWETNFILKNWNKTLKLS